MSEQTNFVICKATKKIFPFITIMYGIGAILVVLGHSHPLHSTYPSEMRDFIYTFHMPLFFYISGILIGNSESRERKIINWWIRKVKRFIVPYLTLSLMAILPKFLLGSIMNDNMEFSVKNIIKILLMPRHNIWGHFWFIPVFLVCELAGMSLMKLICRVKKKRGAYCSDIFKIILLGIGLYISFFPIDIEWLGINDVCVYFIYTLLGIYVFEYAVVKGNYHVVGNTFGVIVASLISLTLFLVASGIIIEKLISILMIYAIMGLSIRISKYENKILKYIGTHAFTIFVWSWPIQAVMEIFLVVLLNTSWKIVYPIMFVSGMFGPIALYEVSNRCFRNSKLIGAIVGK